MKDYNKFYEIANPAVALFKHALLEAFDKGYELGCADGDNDRREERETIHPNCSGCKHYDNEKCTNTNFTSSDLTRCHYEPRMTEYEEVELVIKIPKITYEATKKYNAISIARDEDITEWILKGKVIPKGHGRLKDFEKIYADMKEKEELARQRVIDTPTNSPCYMRYVAQLNERTAFKEMLYDAPTIIEAESESKRYRELAESFAQGLQIGFAESEEQT